jgi:hypothetical protein
LSGIPLPAVPEESIIMHTSRFAMRPLLPAALLTALAASSGRAEDDVVVDDKQGAAQVVPFQGENWGGNVIIMKGLRLQVPGGGDAQANGPDAKENAPMRKQPYLGVVATPVSAAVRAQLELPEGVGVSVDAVAAGSPAEQAGLKPFDVIRMFNDQLIVSDEQLTTLVRTAGAGTKVPLKVLRGGRERLVEAVLGERVVLADGTKVLGLEELMKQLGGNGLDQEELAGVERQLQEALRQAVAGGGGAVIQVPGGARAVAQAAADKGPAANKAPAAAARPEGAPEPGRAIRLVGDANVQPKLQGATYRLAEAGMGVETPLPEGYPAPTPPGMIELKTYPAVRRAEFSGKGASDMGMVKSFFPLFNHIKKRDIAMTSPVEMAYRREGDGKPLVELPVADGAWTVSFLYRKADMGQAGNDGQVKVIDSPAIVVVSIGMKGGYGSGVVQEGLEALQRWFERQNTWEPAGDPRSLMYNGPGAPFGRPWSEVQVPVRRKPQAGAAQP